MTDKARFVCVKCKGSFVKFIPGNSCGNFGEDSIGRKFCLVCSATRELDLMVKTGKRVLYLNVEAREVTDFSGLLSFPTSRPLRSKHNIAGVRYDVWFKGPDGLPWHGYQVGNFTQICHCRRVKK